jgi:putative transposase
MRKLQFAKYECYHLHNQGVDKRQIFSSKPDYDRFEAYLYLLNDEDPPRASNFFTDDRKSTVFESPRMTPLVAIGAYSLLPDRFDLLVTPLVDNGVSKFMQKLQTAYTMYFNGKRDRSGSLFQGTFRAERGTNEPHIKYLFAKINMMPAELVTHEWQDLPYHSLSSLARKLTDYRYSSLANHMESNHIICSPEHFPKYLRKVDDPEQLARLLTQYKSHQEKAKQGKA